MGQLREQFRELVDDCQTHFDTFLHDAGLKIDQLHAENRHRLQGIDTTVIQSQAALNAIQATLAAQDVKLQALYGNGSGRPGAVERLTAKVDGIGDQIKYGMGVLAALGAVVSVIAWFIDHGHK